MYTCLYAVKYYLLTYLFNTHTDNQTHNNKKIQKYTTTHKSNIVSSKLALVKNKMRKTHKNLNINRMLTVRYKRYTDCHRVY